MADGRGDRKMCPAQERGGWGPGFGNTVYTMRGRGVYLMEGCHQNYRVQHRLYPIEREHRLYPIERVSTNQRVYGTTELSN